VEAFTKESSMIETSPRTTTERPLSDALGDDTTPGAAGRVQTVMHDGVVALVGTVSDVRSWTIARDAALRLPGAVVADMTVRAGVRARRYPERSETVARAVHAALLHSGADTSVLVCCDGPVVTLWGRCATRQDRSVATIAAWAVPGIGFVQNWIREDC
jgi:osmotically-inducible protein OsmY